MPSARFHLALLSLTLPALAQTPSPPPAAPRPALNHSLVFLDPAHGGDDAGAHLVTRSGEPLLEKDLTLSLANRIRFQLTSLGLTVLATREADTASTTVRPTNAAPASPAPISLSPDQRAGLANHVHPLACIVLHATGSGSGVHLVTSALTAPPPSEPATLTPWDSAQATFLAQSDRLAAELSTAIAHAGVPVHTSHASVRPLASLACPAVLIELAPLPSATVADPAYQARIAQAVATALLFWRGHAEPDLPSAESPADPGAGQP